jgi:hypothetical protein
VRASADLKQAIKVVEDSTSGKGMLAALMVEWGGVAGMARETRAEYDNFPEGHPARTKILALLLQAALKFGGEGEDGDGDLDDAEAELEETERELAEMDNDCEPG